MNTTFNIAFSIGLMMGVLLITGIQALQEQIRKRKLKAIKE